MRVLFNASTLMKGGGVQVASALIVESRRHPAADSWYYAVTPTVAQNVARFAEIPRDRLLVLDQSPGRSRSSGRLLREFERRARCDAVCTIFGPAFTQFESPQLMGCGRGWVTHPTPLAYSTIPSWSARWKKRLHSAYVGWHLRKSDRWVTESGAARTGMTRRLGIPAERIAVVANTCAQPYLQQATVTPWPDLRQTIRLFCFAANYSHKCLSLIPDVLQELKARQPERTFEFMITLPQDDALAIEIQQRANDLGFQGGIRNVGPVAVADGPALYRQADICFMPTVLETFTATYPEAMAMGLPIVTSDLDFARDCCDDAASYFTARDPKDAARAVQHLLADSRRWERSIARGKQILRTLPTPAEKFELYLLLLKRLVQGQDYRGFETSAASIEMLGRAHQIAA